MIYVLLAWLGQRCHFIWVDWATTFRCVHWPVVAAVALWQLLWQLLWPVSSIRYSLATQLTKFHACLSLREQRKWKLISLGTVKIRNREFS